MPSEFSRSFVVNFARVFLSKIRVHAIDRISPNWIALQGEIRKSGDPVFIMHEDGKLYYADTIIPDEKPDPITVEEFIEKIMQL